MSTRFYSDCQDEKVLLLAKLAHFLGTLRG